MLRKIAYHEVTGRQMPYSMSCIFNYVIIAEIDLLVKWITITNSRCHWLLAICHNVIVECNLRILWKRSSNVAQWSLQITEGSQRTASESA